MLGWFWFACIVGCISWRVSLEKLEDAVWEFVGFEPNETRFRSNWGWHLLIEFGIWVIGPFGLIYTWFQAANDRAEASGECDDDAWFTDGTGEISLGDLSFEDEAQYRTALDKASGQISSQIP
jgi:hypothetical protein